MKNSRNYITGFLSIVLFMVSSISSTAQKIEVGFRMMPAFSAFDIKDASGGTVKGEVRLGFGAGAFVGINLSDHMGIQGEVIYLTHSQKFSSNNVDQKIRLSYVNIPLLLSLNTNKSKLINLNMVAGPQIGIKAGSSLNTSGTNDVNSAQAVLAVKKTDLGIAYGAGIDFGLNSARTFRLGVGYRGVLGLLDISDDNNSLSTNSYYVLDRTHIKTNMAYVGISYLFL